MFDLDVTVYGCTNQCSFVYKSRKVKLMSNQPTPPTQERKVDKGEGKVDALTPRKKNDKGKGKMVMNLLATIKLKRVCMRVLLVMHSWLIERSRCRSPSTLN